jgi:hypothetical protein
MGKDYFGQLKIDFLRAEKLLKCIHNTYPLFHFIFKQKIDHVF